MAGNRPSSSQSQSLAHIATPQRSRPGKRQHPSVLNGIGGSFEDKNNDYLCPICFELIEEAHITRCGHTFCYGCIARSLENFGRCPKCSFVLSGPEHIFPNFLLNDLISKFKSRIKKAAELTPNDSPDTSADGLRQFLAAESENLTLPDVNVILEVLTQRKHILEAETCVAQNRLLYHFLENLLKQKEAQLVQLNREVSLIKQDLEDVHVIVKEADAKKAQLEDQCKAVENEIKEKEIEVKKEEESFNSGKKSVDPALASLTMRKKRMHAHFDDFVSCYLNIRANELIFSKGGEKSEGTTSSGLELFRENLVKFSRYSTLRPLATLNYSPDIFNNSTIVSSIEFDKDNELFAIAGVTKRIKVFDYSCVIRDTVDIHYPSIEMVSSSKISCVSWNSYHKTTLASSDYEGSVTVWDVSTGQRVKLFQEHEKRCWSVDFNEVDTRLIASGSDDAKVKLWSLNMEHSVASLEAKANVCCVKFNPRSSTHLAFGSADHCVHYYDLRNMKEALCVFKGHRKAVSYVKFLNREDIVSASTDSQLKLWNVNDPHCLRSFVGHINEKNFVGLGTDGDYIACGSENNSLFIYYKGLSKQIFSFKFDAVRTVLDKEKRDEDVNEFVSAVCWRQHSNIVVAANSQGMEAGLKKGSSRLFFKVSPDYDVVSVVGIGKQDAGYNADEDIDEKKENVRNAVAAGCKSLQEVGVSTIHLESLTDTSAAAEGARLSLWSYQEFREEKKRKKIPQICAYNNSNENDWANGLILADAQNLARYLAESPANHMTPSIFAKRAEKELIDHGVEVCTYDKKWAEEKKMGAFLSVTRGSDEPPRFLEMKYFGGKKDSKPFVFVGKGVTFDSGGISIKPSGKMEDMRADMMGAACVTASIKAIAQLKLPINVIALTPLCENMPSGSATKPGDVIQAMNGKYIQVDNTDAEGRLILADALCYAATFNPFMTLDIATLTGAMRIALGGALTGAFTNSAKMYEEIRKAGVITGDRVWRCPLIQAYSKKMTDYTSVDINNVGKGGGGGACTAAAFLKEFAPKGDWMHLDIAGVMGPDNDIPYLGKGMTGRPTRTLVQFVSQLAKK